jgi:hypothetical protein
LKVAKHFVEMLTRFPEGIKREDMEAMASSAKAKLLVGGMNSMQALVWNVRTSFWMAREMTKR